MTQARGKIFGEETVDLCLFVTLPHLSVWIGVNRMKPAPGLILDDFGRPRIVIHTHGQSRLRQMEREAFDPGMLRHFYQRRIRTPFEQTNADRYMTFADDQYEYALQPFVEIGRKLHETQIIRITFRHVRREVDSITLHRHFLYKHVVNTSGSF